VELANRRNARSKKRKVDNGYTRNYAYKRSLGDDLIMRGSFRDRRVFRLTDGARHRHDRFIFVI